MVLTIHRHIDIKNSKRKEAKIKTRKKYNEYMHSIPTMIKTIYDVTNC